MNAYSILVACRNCQNTVSPCMIDEPSVPPCTTACRQPYQCLQNYGSFQKLPEYCNDRLFFIGYPPLLPSEMLEYIYASCSNFNKLLSVPWATFHCFWFTHRPLPTARLLHRSVQSPRKARFLHHSARPPRPSGFPLANLVFLWFQSSGRAHSLSPFRSRVRLASSRKHFGLLTPSLLAAPLGPYALASAPQGADHRTLVIPVLLP